MNKILVVESDTVLLELLAELLDLHGFCSIKTTSSAQGYDLAKLEKPDLILCGHLSTNISTNISKNINTYETCWEFLRNIREDLDTANIPFILMTGQVLDTIPNWQNYLTHQEILLKPFNSQVLLEKIYIAGVRSQESGVRSQESGVRSQESGVRSQESGVRSQESGGRIRSSY
ncbi:hypothetical protein A0J48_009335 [Sphaerospermopsis aphanizomenoides BCCUSP55]|uniref:hypothetical protein n=1 Tax=Sphaerospermopsis aphanizomenoides TaxID=459663 RepID=UPI00190323B9|nr:hypothetical protein [Sphaerospermopsis aphanizomenoides]MBK1987736.1 hypothetical protein [Sphaerospermopsis aphanizomenoides BCCUSP55]